MKGAVERGGGRSGKAELGRRRWAERVSQAVCVCVCVCVYAHVCEPM